MSTPLSYPKDCARIQRIAKAHGYNFSLKVCDAIWAARSEDWAASWLFLPESDEEVWSDLVDWGVDSGNEANESSGPE